MDAWYVVRDDENIENSMGFREIGVRPRYYQPEDVDAVVMKRDA